MYKTSNNVLGETIAQQRKNQNISQMELAKNAGISRSYLSSIEIGKNKPSFEVIKKICDSLGLSVNSLISGSRENKTTERYKKIELVNILIEKTKNKVITWNKCEKTEKFLIYSKNIMEVLPNCFYELKLKNDSYVLFREFKTIEITPHEEYPTEVINLCIISKSSKKSFSDLELKEIATNIDVENLNDLIETIENSETIELIDSLIENLNNL